MRTGEAPVFPRPRFEVTSWRAGVQLGGPLPVVEGSWEVTDQAEVKVPGTVSFSVPNLPEWRPVGGDWQHPLALYGQRVRVRVGFNPATSLHQWGWYRLTSVAVAGATIQVQGQGLMRNVERGRFLTPFGVGGWTRPYTLGRILQGIVPYSIATALGAPILPSSLWERERLDAVWDIVETWPARLYVSDSGVVTVTTPWNDATPGAPVWAIVDGEGGNLVQLDPAQASGQDADQPNAWVVSTQPQGAETRMTETWVQPDGPMRWDTVGNGYGQNPNFFESPLLPQNRMVLQQVARDRGARGQRLQTRFRFVALPDSRPHVGDVVTVRSAQHAVAGVGRVLSLALTRTALAGEVALL